MAAALVSHPAYTDCKVVSAGYIEIGGSVCHGSSESLKMNSREQDSRVIDTVDYLHGFPGAVEELHEAGIDIVELLKKKGEPNEQDE